MLEAERERSQLKKFEDEFKEDQTYLHYSLEQKQRDVFSGVAREVQKNSRQFDLDAFGESDDSPLDQLVNSNQI
jgi:hypothetical protein